MNIRTFARAAIYGLAATAALDAACWATAALIVGDADFVRYMTTLSPMLARVFAFQWVTMMVVVWPYAKERSQ